MSDFYRVYYDIQNASEDMKMSYISSPSSSEDENVSYMSSSSSSEDEQEETTIQMNHHNPYLTPKFSYVNPDSFLLKNNYVNDENHETSHNKRRKTCNIIFDSPFSKKSKPQNLFNTSLISEKKEKNDVNSSENLNNDDDDNLSIHTGYSCFSFRPDLLDPSLLNSTSSTSNEDLEYSDISDDEL